MKSFTIVSILVLLVAILGILSQHGHATVITWVSVVPVALWVLVLLASGLLNSRR